MTAHETATRGEWPKGRPPVVSAEEWETARQRLLVKEKALTRARDALAAERRRMPWLAVQKEYAFEGPEGNVNLRGLFAGRRQLIVYRAFFEPGVKGWPEHACVGCSMVADQVAHPAHLRARDTSLALVSRAAPKLIGIDIGRPFDSWWLQASVTYTLSGVVAGLFGALCWFHFNDRAEHRPPA